MAMAPSASSSRHSINDRRVGGASARSRKLSVTSKSDANENHVNVAVRCRPMSEKEISDGHQSIVELEGNKRIIVHDTSESPSDQLGTKSGERRNYSHVYDFNAVFDCNATQKDVYDSVCKPIVDSVLEGYNGTIFAYGQTGTGKTYSMEGVNNLRRVSTGQRKLSQLGTTSVSSANQQGQLTPSSGERLVTKRGSVGDPKSKEETFQRGVDSEESLGIIPRAFRQIFEHVARSHKVQFLIRASYLEIYQEEIHDLLRKDRSIKLELHERPDIGVYVKDLTSFVCKSITEIERVMRVGNQNRMVGATDMNEHSSRSHAIFMITIEQQQQQQQQDKLINDKGNGLAEERVIKVGKLNLVDLAGSERQRKTNSFGQRQRESIKINLSLSALGNVINSLMKMNTQQQQSNNNDIGSSSGGGSFTPYRDSKLTRLLQDSLGGNARTLMIANIGPASYNYDETINTLNYASRAKCIRNRPRLNEDPKDALLRDLQREIDDLRSKLASLNHGSSSSSSNNNNNYKNRGNIGNNKNPSNNNNNKDDSNNEVVDSQIVRRELIELKQKLSSLEGKLLNGDQANCGQALDPTLLQGYTYEQQLKLERSRAELADQANREQAIRDELERREEAELMAKESFSSVQQEVEAKKKLIRQILLKTQAMRNEIEATQKAYRLELDELDQLQYVLQKELKLKCLIMDNFIPNYHVDQLLARIVYDEKRNSCTLTPIDLALDYCNLNDPKLRFENFWQPTGDCIRLRSEFEQIGETIYPSSIRYKYDNFIQPKLETIQFAGKARGLGLIKTNNGVSYNDNPAEPLSAKIQTLIEEALGQHESDIVI